MNQLDPHHFHRLRAEFTRAFDMCRTQLSADAIRDVEHWLQHDELELAFESLGLSLRGESVIVSKEVKSILFPIGVLLGLDRESVLSATFWSDVSPLLKP